jgi:transcriptional regulator with XRE-family HTH domain
VQPGHDPRGEIRQFLSARRARLTQAQVGLPDFGGRRRVAGLRREEVALLAGISVEYYTRLERGHVRGVSDDVIEHVISALQFNDVEREHLLNLVRVAGTPTSGRSRAQPPQPQRHHVLQVLHAMTEAAAFVRNVRLDVVAANRLGRALYSPVFDDRELAGNLARFLFCDPQAKVFYRNWERVAGDAVGSLRQATGRYPDDRALTALITDLTARSDAFRAGWQAQDVRYYRSGTQAFHHPLVGDLDLDYDALEVAAEPGLTLVAYTAAPHSAAGAALGRLRPVATVEPHAGTTGDEAAQV